MRPPDMTKAELDELADHHYLLTLIEHYSPVLHAEAEYLFRERWGVRIEEWRALAEGEGEDG